MYDGYQSVGVEELIRVLQRVQPIQPTTKERRVIREADYYKRSCTQQKRRRSGKDNLRLAAGYSNALFDIRV